LFACRLNPLFSGDVLALLLEVRVLREWGKSFTFQALTLSLLLGDIRYHPKNHQKTLIRFLFFLFTQYFSVGSRSPGYWILCWLVLLAAGSI